MKWLLSFAFFLASQAAIAQKFTAGDLSKIISMTWDQFDTYALSNGYHYFDNQDDQVSHTVYYEIDSNNLLVRSALNHKQSKKIAEILVAYTTINTSDYLAVKNSLKGSGFTSSGTQTDANSISLEYKSKDITATLTTKRFSTAPLVTYEITFIKTLK